MVRYSIGTDRDSGQITYLRKTACDSGMDSGKTQSVVVFFFQANVTVGKDWIYVAKRF